MKSKSTNSNAVVLGLAVAFSILAMGCSDSKRSPPDDGGDGAKAQANQARVSADAAACIESLHSCELELSLNIGIDPARVVIADGCQTGQASLELQRICRR